MKILRSRIKRVKFPLQIYATFTSKLWHPGCQGYEAMPSSKGTGLLSLYWAYSLSYQQLSECHAPYPSTMNFPWLLKNVLLLAS